MNRSLPAAHSRSSREAFPRLEVGVGGQGELTGLFSSGCFAGFDKPCLIYLRQGREGVQSTIPECGVWSPHHRFSRMLWSWVASSLVSPSCSALRISTVSMRDEAGRGQGLLL